MPKRWLVKKRWLVELEATTQTRIYAWAAAIREMCMLVCTRGPNNVGKNFVVILYSHKIFLYIFFVRKYFYNALKKSELRYIHVIGTCTIYM